MKNRIRVRRAELEISQDETAKRAEISRTALNLIEKNKAEPKLITAMKICNVLNSKIEDIFFINNVN